MRAFGVLGPAQLAGRLHQPGPGAFVCRASGDALELVWVSDAAASLVEHAAQSMELLAAVRACTQTADPAMRRPVALGGRPAWVSALPGGLAVVELGAAPLQDGASAPHVATLRKLAAGVAQQRAVADLGSLALQTIDTVRLIERAVRVVAEVLDIEVVTVLRAEPGGLRTVAGNDEASAIGSLLPADGPRSQAGLTLLTGETVVSTDVEADQRFVWAADGCHDSLVGGVTTLIGDVGSPWGVLCAHSCQPRDYDPDDQHFMVGVANVVAAALERSAFEAHNRWAALHDALTGLPNRASLHDRLTHALAKDRRTGACTAVLLLDLDGFKYVNDSLGHEVGDALLVSLAPLLAAAVRPSDMVGRLGGDEFVVVCEDLPSEAEALAIAERVRALWGQPLSVRDAEVFVQGSIGVAVARAGRSSADTLLREADAAMYSAKAGADGGIALFDENLRWRAASRLRLETALRRALARDEMFVVYQPVVDVPSGQPVGAEALVRWRLPSGEMVGPTEFIPLAEECGLIHQIGDWVLREAVRTFASWVRRHGGSGARMLTVNVSGRQLARPGYAEQVLAVLEEEGLPPAQLGLEITESVVLQEPVGARAALARLREAGVSALLDDFGTGYSSLSWLRQLPANALKVDRSFVAGLALDPADASVVEAVVALGHSLGLVVVAEGVEDEDQLAALRRMGCPRAQGYYFARPLPALEAEAYLFGRLPAA